MFSASMWALRRGSVSPLQLQPCEFWCSQGGCCLEDIGDATNTDSAENCTPASTCASRMRGTLLLLEGLLDILVETDENAVVWEPEVSRRFRARVTSSGRFVIALTAHSELWILSVFTMGMSSPSFFA